MLDAPQHDWSYYEAKTRDSDAAWNRELSTKERFDLYASLFNTIWNARQSLRETGIDLIISGGKRS